jgi:hypothetical protein
VTFLGSFSWLGPILQINFCLDGHKLYNLHFKYDFSQKNPPSYEAVSFVCKCVVRFANFIESARPVVASFVSKLRHLCDPRNVFFSRSLQVDHVAPINRVEKRYCLRGARVARWFVFKPKIQIWVNFGGP